MGQMATCTARSKALPWKRAEEGAVHVAICLNVLFLMLWANPIDPYVLFIYEAFNYAFVVLFAVEAAIKITAHTLRDYLRSPWNAFDFSLVAFSIVAAITSLVA